MVEAISPELVYTVTAFATVAICSHGPVEVGACSILKPVSLLELSCHLSWIWFDESAAAVRLDGARGTVCLLAAQSGPVIRRWTMPITKNLVVENC